MDAGRGCGGSAAGGGVLLVSDRPELIDEVVELAAAAGARLVVSADPTTGVWRQAAAVLVDAARAAALVRRHPSRPGVCVVARGADPAPWGSAVALGAGHVVVLPTGRAWLAALVTRLAGYPDAERAVAAAGPATGASPAVGNR